jgi:hypothetical protein
LWFVLVLAGCRSHDLVEMELRTRERELREAREELANLEAHNEALQHELSVVHQGEPHLPPEHTALFTSIRRIVLGRQTGGYDDDRKPGDEALQVVIEPRDGDDHRIKAPGAVHIEALEISPEGLKVPLSSWDIPPEQLRRTWREGLFGSGYYVVLPWKVWPCSPELRVIVRFTLADGRVFEADRDVKVHVVPGAAPRAPRVEETPGPVLPEPGPTLPSPRPLDSGAPPPPRPLGPAVPPPPPPPAPGGVQPAVYLRRPLPMWPERETAVECR